MHIFFQNIRYLMELGMPILRATLNIFAKYSRGYVYSRATFIQESRVLWKSSLAKRVVSVLSWFPFTNFQTRKQFFAAQHRGRKLRKWATKIPNWPLSAQETLPGPAEVITISMGTRVKYVRKLWKWTIKNGYVQCTGNFAWPGGGIDNLCGLLRIRLVSSTTDKSSPF